MKPVCLSGNQQAMKPKLPKVPHRFFPSCLVEEVGCFFFWHGVDRLSIIHLQNVSRRRPGTLVQRVGSFDKGKLWGLSGFHFGWHLCKFRFIFLGKRIEFLYLNQGRTLEGFPALNHHLGVCLEICICSNSSGTDSMVTRCALAPSYR